MAAAFPLPRLLARREPGVRVDLPPLSRRLQLARAALVGLAILSLAVAAQLVIVSGIEQRAAQQRGFDRLREALATGVAPVAPNDGRGHALALGTPMAYLEVPSIHLRQVVVEGTTSGTLFAGPGHRRDSPFPGQAGVSVILGRAAAFGGPFGRLSTLRRGALVRVTTGQGEFEYRVTGHRKDGEPTPAPPYPGTGRLVLATAAGRPFVPDGVLRVDAVLATPGLLASRPPFTNRTLPSAEQLMGADTSMLWALALWLQLLLAVALGAVWAWHRWQRAKAWVVFVPLLLLAFLLCAGEALRLLPNLL